MAREKPIAIEPVAFEEEPLPSGRKLLHLIFKQKFGDSHYKWTPPWKGDLGVEKIFFKALEIEEWNDYDGVWSKELKEAAKEIPSLADIRLPIEIRLGRMTESEDTFGSMTYQVAIELSISETREMAVYKSHEDKKDYLNIGFLKIPWDSLKSFLLGSSAIHEISDDMESIFVGDYTETEEVGVRFYICLRKGLSRIEYQDTGRKISSDIRAFIRKYLSDYHSLKKGFEEA